MLFEKYQGAGNDFIIIDNRKRQYDERLRDVNWVSKICDRHFGIGADGLIAYGNCEDADFLMTYFNADGREASLCGNGSRCIIAWASKEKLIAGDLSFKASDGIHKARIISEDLKAGTAVVAVQMNDIKGVSEENKGIFLNTGSPHYVSFVKDLNAVNVRADGRAIRNAPAYKAEGTNVNFVEIENGERLKIRTYERGVEDETLACGTGVTAAVIAAADRGLLSGNSCDVIALGGELSVQYKKSGNIYTDIWLQGPAQFVFKGEYRS